MGFPKPYRGSIERKGKTSIKITAEKKGCQKYCINAKTVVASQKSLKE